MHTVIELSRTERIIAVVPEKCSGPGWSNFPVWVYIADSTNNQLRTEVLQQDELSYKMYALCDVGEVLCKKLIEQVPVKRSMK